MAVGTQLDPGMPLYAGGIGIKTEYGTLLPPGSKVAAYVRSTLVQSYTDNFTKSRLLVATLAQGLAACRSGLGDTVMVLPGHSESVSDATMLDNLVDGTRIVGVGTGSMQPVFRWTATGSQWAMNNADVSISGLHLRLEGASGVVKAILVTGASNSIQGCRIQLASGASNKAAIGIEVGTGADDFVFVENRIRGTATHNVTDGLKFVAAVSDAMVANCSFIASATAGNGLIHVTAAALNLDFHDLFLYNTHTSSTATIALDDVACDGHFARIYSAVKTDGTATAEGVTFGAAALVQCNEVYCVDSAAKNGILSPVVET